MTASNTTDVAIIGGGIMGSAVALRLAQRGVGVTVVERGIPGAEASSAAAGILGPQMEAEGPGPLLELGLASRALYPSLAAELRDATGIDVGYDRSGVLAVALDDAGEQELGASARLAAAAQLERRVARSGDEVRTREPALGPAIRAALRISRGRAGQRARAGAGVLAGGGVRGRALSDRTVRAARGHRERAKPPASSWTARRCLPARVVVAAGSWSGLVEGGGVPATVVRPARGQLVSIETRPPLFRHVVSVRGGYIVPRRDGTVIAGSTVEMAGFRKQVTVAGLAGILTLARTLVPALGRRAGDGDLVELPPVHRGSPAGAGRDAGARPRARDRPLPQRHPAGADHRRGDRRAGRDRAVGDRSRAVLRDALRAAAPLPNPLPAPRGEGTMICSPSPACGRGRGEGKPCERQCSRGRGPG